MDREAERKAWARAKGYLNYNAVAKWSALIAAAGSGILFVGLLVVLWLYADQIVNRGNIPSFRDLAPERRDALAKEWKDSPDPAVERLYKDLGESTERTQYLTQTDVHDQSPREQELNWRLHLYELLRHKVNGTAAALVLPAYWELPDLEKEAFAGWWDGVVKKDRLRDADLGFSPEQIEQLSGDVRKMNRAQQDVSWQVYLYQMFRYQDGRSDKSDYQTWNQLAQELRAEAATPEFRIDPNPPLADKGILSLIVRTHFQSALFSTVTGWIASPMMWRSFTPYLTFLLAAALVVVLLRSLLTFVQMEMAARATIEASTRLRRAVYHHTFRMGTLAIRELGPSEAVSIFTRHVEAVHDGLYSWMTVFFRDPVRLVLVLAFALMVHVWLALLFLLCAVLVWLVGGQIAEYYRRQGRAASNRAAELLTLIRESLMLMRLVKVYLMELFNQARVERLLARHAALQQRRYRGEAISAPLLALLGTVAVLAVLYVAGLIVLHDQLGVPGAIALATALISLYWPLLSVVENRKYLRRGHDASVVLFKFLDRPGEVGQMVGAEFLAPLTKRLEFDNVSLREPGTSRMLLQEVAFTVKAGQRVGLVGAEDHEKHALVYLIPRFLDPTSGEIRIDDHNLRFVTLDSLRAQFSVVLQHNLVFHDSVANNISCGDPAYKLPQIIEAAKTAHAHHFIQKLPQGYETTIGELGHSLSTSEMFRVALARAILRDPALVVIEEPLNQLDEDTKSLLDDTFARFLPGRTVIFLPHRISTIRSCDQIFLLHKGRLEATGIHRELLSQNPLYRHLHYLEFSEMAEQV